MTKKNLIIDTRYFAKMLVCFILLLVLPSQSLIAANDAGAVAASERKTASQIIRNDPEQFISAIPEVPSAWEITSSDGSLDVTVKPANIINIEIDADKQSVPADSRASEDLVVVPNEGNVESPNELAPLIKPFGFSTDEVSSAWSVEITETLTPAVLPVPDSKIFVEVPDEWEMQSLGFEQIPEKTVPKDTREKPPDKPSEKQENIEPLTDTEPLVSKTGIWSALPHRLILNGKMQRSLHAYETPASYLLLPFLDIAHLLGDELHIDEQGQRVRYRRSRDGAYFELDTKSGEVIANEQSAGFLAEVSLIDLKLGLFPSNAVQVFSGLHIKRDDENGVIGLTLDKRLQFVTGFELYVNGELLPYVNPEPRSLGHVLLLPIRPIIEELGSELRVSADRTTLTVVRKQDTAEISLNMTTGLVFIDGKPVGTAPNMAYADRNQLMLPREALASLTGTYVTLLPGSRRINVDLDDDLARIIHPGDTIRGRARAEGAKIDSVEAFVDTRQTASATVKGHYKDYNMTLDYATPTTAGDDAFTPDWLKLSAQSIDGWRVSVGDQDTHKRELDGVSVSHLKGIYFSNSVDAGILVGTLGQAQSGRRELDGGDTVPTFSGSAAGLRFAQHNGDFEAGVALRNDSEKGYKAVVASTYKRTDKPDFSLGELYQRTDVALGLYDYNDKTSPGGHFAWDARLEPNDKLSLSARTDYSSSAVVAGIVDDDEVTDSAKLADSLTYGVGATLRQGQNTFYSLNHNRSLKSIFEGAEDGEKYWSEATSLGVSLLPFQSRYSPWTYLAWDQTSAGDQESVRRITGQTVWGFGQYSLLAKHVDQEAEINGKSWLTSLELSREPWQRFFEKNSSLSLSPRANAWKSDANLHANMGALLAFSSGRLLGKRTRLGMSYGRNLGVTVMKDIDSEDSDEEKVSIIDGSDYFGATLNYRFNRLLKLSSSYYSDLDGHDESYASVSAYYEFNPPRRLKNTQDNAGLLMGQVFLDENFDGIQQENERGVANSRVVIQGTPIGLNTDHNGRFTIQNLPVGIYRIKADISRMPLGYITMPGTVPAVKIGDARITEIAVPLTKGSQLSGVVYIDKNYNGELDKSDQRLENIGLELNNGAEAASTVFGQYTFDFLPPGKYTLSVQSDTLPDDVIVDDEQNFTIDIRQSKRNRLLIRLLDRSRERKIAVNR